jgi:hypothetical protein
LQAIFVKLTSLHSKNNFSIAIVAGNLFDGDDDAVANLLAGNIAIPLPAYSTVGTSPLSSKT